MEPVRLTREGGTEPVIYYANSNIHPGEEYARRLATLEAWAQGEHLEVVEGSYDAEAWEKTVGRIGDAAREKFGVITHEAQPAEGAGVAPDVNAGNNVGAESNANAESVASMSKTPLASSRAASNEGAEGGDEDMRSADSAGEKDSAAPDDRAEPIASPDGTPTETLNETPAEQARQARCRACYRMRFEETARYAAEHGFAAIGTTLSVSPYQYTNVIREELERAAAKEGVEARFVDYRPYYDNATQRSREAGMYRQNYCACRFSEEEARLEREERKRARKQKQAAEAAAHAAERAAEKAQLEARRAERAAYDAKQARKRAVLKQLREQGR